MKTIENHLNSINIDRKSMQMHEILLKLNENQRKSMKIN